MIEKLYKAILSEKRKEQVEKITLMVAIISYLSHLLIIFLNTRGILDIEQKFFKNPIAAIYTPFSFILIFEVFLLVYYLPKSITAYIGKQYEIITLIVIRKIFKDLAYVELDSNWFQNKDDLQFTIDVITSLALFFLIYLFHKAIRKRNYVSIDDPSHEVNIKKFIALKQILAITLVPVLFFFASYSLINWGVVAFKDHSNGILEFSNINNIFFDEFFNILIIIDVLLLLASFFYSDNFYKIIRNSGFVISTILIKISFSAAGIVGNLLIISAVIFGYLMLSIHNLYEKETVQNS
jgi:hypothetical protein